MKKYTVKVGEDFALDATVSVHVQVNVQGGAPEAKKESFSWQKVVTIFLVSAMLTSVLAATTYGVVTGDFSFLKAIASVGEKAISAGVEYAKASAK